MEIKMKKTKKILALILACIMFCMLPLSVSAETLYARENQRLYTVDGTDYYPLYAVIMLPTTYDSYTVYSICRTGVDDIHFHMSLGSLYQHMQELDATSIWKTCRTTQSTGINEMTQIHYCSSHNYSNGDIKRVIERYSVNYCYDSVSGHTSDVDSLYETWWDFFGLDNPDA